MKTLIVSTDFSPAADNAMHYAAHLASQAGAEIILTHVYQIPVSMNDMPIILVSAEELKKGADENLERCAQDLADNYPGLRVRTESRLGDVNEELYNLGKEVNPIAIVMGSHGESGLERLIFGSTTLSVIRYSKYPVIAVPAHFKTFSLKNVVLAVDLQGDRKMPFETILELLELLHVNVNVVHVTNGGKNNTELQRDILLNQLQPLHPTYKIIQNEKVREGLLNYLTEVQADLLIVLPHEHNLMERLFFKLHTLDIVKHAPVPVMTIRC